MQFKNKRKILYAIIFILIQLIILIPPYLHVSEKRHALEQHETETLRDTYRISVDSYDKITKLLYAEVINRPEILQLMASANTTDVAQQNRARQELYLALKETYQNLQSFNLRQLHFHLPDGTSFLRFHRPDKFGDKLFDVRYSVKWANTQKKPIYGFEEGRIYNGFRYVFPLFYENKHIGSVETSISFSAIEEMIKQVIPGELVLLLKKQMVVNKVFNSEQDNYHAVALTDVYVEETAALKNRKLLSSDLLSQINLQLRPDIAENLALEQSFIMETTVQDIHYLITFIPISNVQEYKVGYLVAYNQGNQLNELQWTFYERYVGLSIINILIFTLFISIIESKNRISSQNVHLNLLMQEKNEIMGIVAHDLKNPLSAIKGYAEELNEEAEQMSLEEIHLYAGKIEYSSQRMFGLITNLLDVNAIESGKIKVVLQSVQLDAVLAECVANHRDQATQKNIILELTRVACQLETDPQLFQQVMNNLISNAIKYSHSQTTVSIQMHLEGEKVECIVEDQGPGLSSEDLTKLFGKFTRLTPLPTAGEHSTGLGLFIVKKLVDTLGGRIWCESELGKGTKFIVQLG